MTKDDLYPPGILARTPDLDTYRALPLAEPLPAQRRIFNEALRLARACGLQLPSFRLTWVAGGTTMYGATIHSPSGADIEVVLSVDLWPDQLFQTALHELVHVHDAARGYGFQYDREGNERRAIEFVRRVGARRRTAEW